MTRLPLSEGYWIEVKQRLTVGERRDAEQVAAGLVMPDGSFRPNVSMQGISLISAYLVDWNLTGLDGKVVLIDTDQKRLGALRAVDQETFNEIDLAIGQHIEATRAEEQNTKKATHGDEPSGQTSPSAA